MKRNLSALMILLLSFFSACAPKVWQTSSNVSPSSYAVLQTPAIERSVGKLRRLVLLPVKHEMKQILSKREPEQKNYKVFTGAIASSVRELLVNTKGYDVVPMDLYEDMLPEKLYLSREQVQTRTALLLKWAASSADGEDPPRDVSNAVSALGRPLNADGLLIIQGYSKDNTAMAVLTILTASLTWPLLLASNDFAVRADIYEVSTGKIVWRASWKDIDDMWALPSDVITRRLFGSLEPAIPKAITKPLEDRKGAVNESKNSPP